MTSMNSTRSLSSSHTVRWLLISSGLAMLAACQSTPPRPRECRGPLEPINMAPIASDSVAQLKAPRP
jgi:hypothetical protein